MSNELRDAAKRVSGEYAMHRLADPLGNYGKWFAVRLSDGSSDHVLYDTKTDAVRGQHHDEQFYAFVQIGPWPMGVDEAETYLKVQRRAYDAGLRLSDRESGGKDLIRRVTKEDQYNQLRAMFIGDRTPSNIIIPDLGRF